MEPIHSYIPNSWKERLLPIFNTEKMGGLEAFLEQEEQNKATTYPTKNNIFNALKLTAFENVKVVILGQDPYHGEGQAHGLSFSVPKGVKIPPSLRNIYKEIHSDLGYPTATHGNLESWAKQGVLLLNSVLTVRAGEAGSHAGQGWETFTDEIIKKLNEKETPIVFMLWGSYAQKKGKIINKNKHFVLESVHPSPLSAHRGFFGCKHFSKANNFLKEQGIAPINWQID